uniref:Uncharacterized protein n=1 Tax=Physcomitrium patens TaxID=3218 RepID=A0A2K1IEJ2_PHYPA|nr:hypothetical protein PHYPA_029848 [Physcomitrium patens]
MHTLDRNLRSSTTTLALELCLTPNLNPIQLQLESSTLKVLQNFCFEVIHHGSQQLEQQHEAEYPRILQQHNLMPQSASVKTIPHGKNCLKHPYLLLLCLFSVPAETSELSHHHLQHSLLLVTRELPSLFVWPVSSSPSTVNCYFCSSVSIRRWGCVVGLSLVNLCTC